ncbi:spatacsin isoform X3 [Gadus macrocephalus]|uniref:spatacsin isoform X3 n=1 Tax=Gadus macrocephalus TaxID=80720 RepID=UPI0028CB6448|nr:spatacsin isoform X3 [Gadus macrocephalus]
MSQQSSGLEVLLVPGHPLLGRVRSGDRVALLSGGALLGRLDSRGGLTVGDLADRGEVLGGSATLEGSFSDFAWEEVTPEGGEGGGGGGGPSRLLAVTGSQDVCLVTVVTGAADGVGLVCVSECPAGRLLKMAEDSGFSVSRLQSVRLLSFQDSCSVLLLNSSLLLTLHWRQEVQGEEEARDPEESQDLEESQELEKEEEEVQMVSSCSLLVQGEQEEVSSSCLSAGVLFLLCRSGLICGYDITAGSLLATVDLPSYLSSLREEEPSPSPSSSASSSHSYPASFSQLRVSADLSTAVALSPTHTAVAVDLNHYFRTRPDHLLGAEAPGCLMTPEGTSRARDAGSLNTDRSWGARLTRLYSTAQGPAPSQGPAPWFSGLPEVASRMALSQARLSFSRVPPGGATALFSVPASSIASLLSVSQFSALVTFVSPDDGQSSVALWDLESQAVSYHRCESASTAVKWKGPQHTALLIKRSPGSGGGLSQVMFDVDQQRLLSRLMVFGKAATVDALCHLNTWGRCSIPMHALQAGLKNRQLDTVDLFLKSKEELLSPSELPPDPRGALLSRVQEVCPALDLLCCTIRDGHAELQSRAFSEQLLRTTLTFLQTQLRTACCSTHQLDAELQSCVSILNRYVFQLWTLMRSFPWASSQSEPAAPNHLTADSQSDPAAPSHLTADSQSETEQHQRWEHLSTEEAVRRAVLCGRLPCLQAFLRSQNRPEQTLPELRRVGLQHAFCCLAQRQLPHATTLFRNMGFHVNEVLHSVCLYTDQKELRDFVVEELTRKQCFSHEETQRVQFFREVEKLGATARLTHPPQNSLRVLELARSDPQQDPTLLGLDPDPDRVPGGAGLWSRLRLDWIRHWTPNALSSVRLSRLQDEAVVSCDAQTLWSHLTALNNQQRLSRWIQSSEDRDAPCWPAITPQLVRAHTACCDHTREQLLNLLARKGIFAEGEELDLLMCRLVQVGGVMCDTAPSPRYHLPIGPELHTHFITHCLNNNLQYLLYTYLQHHRLTQRTLRVGVPGRGNLEQDPPWFHMMLRVQEVAQDLSDPERLFQASLTSAQVLVPGGQASLSSLLLEGHGVVALASLMFPPGGVDGVVAPGPGPPAHSLDHQLLRMALGPYPKLRSALFPPGGPRAGLGPPDVSIYQLLQSLHPLHQSRLFGWQTANPLLSTGSSEPPHFSSPLLVSRWALVERMDFLYFLRHSRPSYAYASFLLHELAGSADMTPPVQQALRQASRLALLSCSQPSVAAACLGFLQLLGAPSLGLRVDLRALRLLQAHRGHRGQGPRLDLLGEAKPGAAQELIGYLEEAVTDSLEQRGIPRSSMEAGQEWAVPVQFCQLHSLALSSVYPAHCAADGQWLHFLLFVQLHSFPPNQVRTLASQFGPALQGHLSLAFEELRLQGPGWPAPGPQRELLQVALQSQLDRSPWRRLLGEALERRCPLLAVLAACAQVRGLGLAPPSTTYWEGAEPLQCLCVWVLTSVDDVTAAEATAHLQDAAQHHDWTLHDLSIIWKNTLSGGRVKPLLLGFTLFQKESPLVLLLEMFELCAEFRNYDAARDKLLLFQHSLLSLRSSGAEGWVPQEWVESQASVLLMVLFQRSSDHFHLQRLVQLLHHSEHSLQAHGVDLGVLARLSAVLQGSPVRLPLALLSRCSPQVLQEEYQCLLEELVAAGLLSRAQRVAQLAGIPADALLINQLQQDVQSQRSKRRWGQEEVRVLFWRRCHQQLQGHAPDPQIAAHFFQEQAGARPLCAQERCLLLGMAGHWLSLVEPTPLERLEALEKESWISRLQEERQEEQQQQEQEEEEQKEEKEEEQEEQKEEKEEEDAVLNPGGDTTSYDSLMEEFSFSRIAALNHDSYLSLAGLPGPDSPPPPPEGADPPMGPARRRLLGRLIGQLLDEGRVHEASRACRYFSVHLPDVWLALRCRELATGGASNPQPQEGTSDPGTSVPSSPSSGSPSSFVMLPPPDDPVLTQLQALLDQCHHGNNYCRQILSLYQLSKDLRCSFEELSQEEPQTLLDKLLRCGHPERYRRAEAFVRAQGLAPEATARFLANAALHGLQAEPPEPPLADRQVLRLCGDSSLLGRHLLDKIPTLRVSQVACSVELLVLAHDCFSLSCDMEGIVRVLHAARHLSHAHLAPGQHFNLLVRLLTGIGRYDDMTYVFDLLHQNHRFEILLRKKLDIHTSSSLKAALLDYIKRCLPGDSEKHNMVALHFSMRREIGENHEMAARTQLKIIHSQPWAVTPELSSSLTKVLGLLKDAAESYHKDECVRQASRCVRLARLVVLQLHLLSQGSDQRLINLQPAETGPAMLALPRCYQVCVLAEAYEQGVDWAELVYQKVVVGGDFVYLEQLKTFCPLGGALMEEVSTRMCVKEAVGGSSSQNLKRLLAQCEDVVTRYRLAYKHKLTDLAQSLLTDARTSSYLSDHLAV